MIYPIEIVCGIDSNYAPHLAVMLKSLAKNNQKHHFRIHVLHDDVPEDVRRRVGECNKEMEMNWINAANHPVLNIEGVGHISRAAYLRLMMLDVLDLALKRVLYLDADIIINGDISTLWNTPLGDKVCAAVADAWVNATKFSERWHLPKGRYFNSGVILFDLDKLRSKPYMKQAVEMAASSPKGTIYVDQDALNFVLWNDWLEVGAEWNFQRGYLYDHHASWDKDYQPVIIHYTETFKPWKNTEWHPCGWLYLRTLFSTPFKSDVSKAGNINIPYILRSWLKWALKRPSMFRLPRRT